MGDATSGVAQLLQSALSERSHDRQRPIDFARVGQGPRLSALTDPGFAFLECRFVAAWGRCS
jgi:hypothetical protein